MPFLLKAVYILLLALPLAAEDEFALQIYRKHCASCHDAVSERIPSRAALSLMSANAIAKALDTGAMREQGAKLGRSEQRAVANWLGNKANAARPLDQMANRCAPDTSWAASQRMPSWTSWGGDLANRRMQSETAAGIQRHQVPRLKLKWAFGMPDTSTFRSQPAVFAGRVFAGGQDGTVFALDAASGCTHWATSIPGSVKSGMSFGVVKGSPTLFFGDSSGAVYALEAATGRLIWRVEAGDHPAAAITGTPVYYDGRLIIPVASGEEGRAISQGYACCTFRGSVLSVDAATGAQQWRGYTISEPARPGKPTRRGAATLGPSGAGVWTPPTIDPDKRAVYVTTGDNYSDPATATSDAVLAFSLDTGAMLWSRQLTAGDAYNSSCVLADKVNCPDSDGPDFDFGAPPILVRLKSGRRALVLAQKSGMLHAVDPDRRGEILWQARVGEGGVQGGIQWGPAADNANVYVALSDVRFSRVRVGDTNRFVQQPDPARGGGMFAFRLDNGERIWHTPAPGCGDRRPCSPAQSAPVTTINGVAFSGSLDGHLRGYATGDGKVIWDFDTARPFDAVNSVPARGGSMDAAGPVIAGGMMFVVTGYSQWGGQPGNALLAFSVDGK